MLMCKCNYISKCKNNESHCDAFRSTRFDDLNLNTETDVQGAGNNERRTVVIIIEGRGLMLISIQSSCPPTSMVRKREAENIFVVRIVHAANNEMPLMKPSLRSWGRPRPAQPAE
eukprot:636741-Prorocentrum_minimum.AAC.2